MADEEKQKIVENSKLLQQVKAYFLVAKHKEKAKRITKSEDRIKNLMKIP